MFFKKFCIATRTKIGKHHTMLADFYFFTLTLTF